MVRIFLSKNGQIKVTIPKRIAQAMNLGHRQGIEIVFNGEFWEFRKAKKGMVKVFLLSNGQMKMTIPKVLAGAMQMKHRDEIELVSREGKWELRKSEKEKGGGGK
jgi:bifunctional DNA-binding transcriptional regulator/antitoxin component of YhaV-PrlF toxin-antitoxin module